MTSPAVGVQRSGVLAADTYDVALTTLQYGTEFSILDA